MKCLVNWSDALIGYFSIPFPLSQRYNRYYTSCQLQSHFLICSRASSNCQNHWRESNRHSPDRTDRSHWIKGQSVFRIIPCLVGLLFPQRSHVALVFELFFFLNDEVYICRLNIISIWSDRYQFFLWQSSRWRIGWSG